MRSRHVIVSIDLDCVRAAAESIRRRTGVGLIAVIKADAYGLGAARVADALASVADDFAYFSLAEAQAIGRGGLVLGPPDGDADDYRQLGLRPSVATREEFERFSAARPALNIDTGMQRFGCSLGEADELISRYRPEEAVTHAVTPEAVRVFDELCRGRVAMRHAAATTLLERPDSWLSAVRPGLALYRGAVRASTRLVAVRETRGRVGYSGFEHPRVGIILAGYSNHVSPGPVLINGRRQRLIEAGMNSSFVSVDAADRVGDEVVLLGDGLSEAELAAGFGTRPHEVLCRYTAMGTRSYGHGSPQSRQTRRATPLGVDVAGRVQRAAT
jgi:alanine racemase